MRGETEGGTGREGESQVLSCKRKGSQRKDPNLPAASCRTPGERCNYTCWPDRRVIDGTGCLSGRL